MCRRTPPSPALIVGNREICAINCKLLTNFSVEKRWTRLGRVWVGPESPSHQEAARSETVKTACRPRYTIRMAVAVVQLNLSSLSTGIGWWSSGTTMPRFLNISSNAAIALSICFSFSTSDCLFPCVLLVLAIPSRLGIDLPATRCSHACKRRSPAPSPRRRHSSSGRQTCCSQAPRSRPVPLGCLRNRQTARFQ
jgi:hypothetical protein